MAKKRLSFMQSLTIEQLHIEYVQQCRNNNLSPFTIDGYHSQYSAIDKCCDTSTYLFNIDKQFVEDLIKSLQTNLNGGAVTINCRLAYFRCLLKYAVEQEYVDSMPTIKLLKESPKPKVPLTDEEIKQLLTIPACPTFHEYRNKVICQLILATGIRSRNVREVKVSDLDLQAKTLYLKDTKNGKPYTIHLSPTIISILSQYLNKVSLSPDSVLFPNVYGQPFCKNGFTRSMSEYFKVQGVERCHLHLLRHTYASRLAQSNIPLPIISQLLCHSSLVTTQRYVHTLQDDVKQAVDEMDILNEIQSKITPKKRTKIKL